jgi:hypothetical protein
VSKVYRFTIIIVLFLSLNGCNSTESIKECSQGDQDCELAASITGENLIPTNPLFDATETPIPETPKLFIDEAIQSQFREVLSARNDVTLTTQINDADITVSVYNQNEDETKPGAIADWLYVAAVPFRWPVQSIDSRTVKMAWQGILYSKFNTQPLLVSAETDAYFSTLWGKADSRSVRIIASKEMLTYAKAHPGSWALLPFEEVTPQWRILSIGETFPLSRTLDHDAYPLMARYFIQSRRAEISPREFLDTNLHEEQLTSLLLTGTTALVRNLAYQMEIEGIEYPLEAVKDEFLASDITHISNEVPMFVACPPAVPLRVEMRFCSSPNYIHLFKVLDISFVELSGNHELDWWAEPFLETLALYKQNDIPYVGGGKNLQEALKPLEMEDHDNKFVFFSCNDFGPVEDIADENHPGSAPCNFEKMAADIAIYRSKGYLPVVLLQYMEVETVAPSTSQRIDFNALAEAGAIIVSGSQAHMAQTFALNGDALIHYGLGNTFFDQIQENYRTGMMDKHYFYQGRYVGLQIIPVEITDSYQTRLMTEDEQIAFLTRILGEME